MALATRCPHCHTTFRVAHDQLKLRAGIVRCGACKQIFNGIEHLLPPAEAAPSLAIASHASTVVAPPSVESASPPVPDPVESQGTEIPEPAPAAFTINSLDFDIPIEPEHADEPPAEMSTASPPLKTDHIFIPPAFTKAEYRLDEPEESTPLSQDVAPVANSQPVTDLANSPVFAESASQSLPVVPPRSAQDDDQNELAVIDDAADAELPLEEEPGFVRKWQQQQRTGKMRRVLMGIASVVLLIGLLVQGIYVFRKHIAAWFPTTEPVLAQMCKKIGCQVNLPAQITAVSIESSELQTLAAGKNTFALTLLLGNHSQLTQAWPNIELTLNDGNEKPVARRIFMPNEYLSSSPGKGIPANTEQPVKLFFELMQLKASGYRVYLFYS